MVYYIQLNVISLILCFIIQFREAKDKQEIFTSKSFRHILFIIELIIVLDTMSLLIQKDIIPHNYWFHLMIMNGYFILQALFPMELFRYCAGIDSSRKPSFKGQIYVPFVCNVIAVVINSIHPFAYEIIENDVYRRMSSRGFFFIIAWPIVYVVAGIYIIAANYRKSTGKKKEIYWHIIVFGGVAFAGGILAFLFKGILLWPVISFDLIYLYLNVLSKTNKKLDILAFKDSLTGIGNVASYDSFTEHVHEQIEQGNAEFALVVMDANGLKFINDNYGHEAGNKYIKECAMFICNIFDHSPVFRIGGDEFIAILEKSDYHSRDELIKKFDTDIADKSVEFEKYSMKLSIARGMAEYKKGMSFSEVFYHADSEMYLNKAEVKKRDCIPSR